jgi:hypothetical protein
MIEHTYVYTDPTVYYLSGVCKCGALLTGYGQITTFSELLSKHITQVRAAQQEKLDWRVIALQAKRRLKGYGK